VAIGIGLLVVGGAVVYAVFGTTVPGSDQSTHVFGMIVPAGATAAEYVFGINGSGVAFALSWHASGAVNASLAVPMGCAGNASSCTLGAPLVHWSSPTTDAAWSTATASDFPWVVTVHDPGRMAVTISLTTTAVRAAPPSPSGWEYDTFVVAGATLGAIGAVTLFLGLFLQGGVYRRNPPGRRPGDPPDEPSIH
jgi:hypothetical protein